MALRFGKLEDALIAGARSEKAAEAEEVLEVVEVLHRMECGLVHGEVLMGSTLGGVGLVAAGVPRRCSKSMWADACGAHGGSFQASEFLR